MGEQEFIKLFGQRKDLKPEHKKLIYHCIPRKDRGNNLYNKGYSTYNITEELLEFTKYNAIKQDFKMKGLKIKSDINIKINIPLDIWNNTIDLFKFKPNINLKRCVRDFGSLSRLCEVGKTKKNIISFNVPHNTKKDGRLHSEFTLMTRKLRHSLFIGRYDIDMDVAMPTIISQYAEDNFNSTTLNIKNYINNKTEDRQRLAKKLDVDIQVIKKLFNMPFFGAVMPSVKQIKNSPCIDGKPIKYKMLKLLGEDKINILRNDVDWCNYYNEVHKINSQFKKLGTTAHSVYFYFERQILDILLFIYGDEDIIPIHDGFILTTEVDLNQLSKYVYIKTGFEVTFSQKLIC